MTDTIITVQGEHSAWYPAERATVRAAVHAFGAKREPVFARALAAAETLRSQIEPMVDKDAGPVTWWSSDRVSVWSERPWNNEGKQLPLVYHASLDVTAKFKDFDALSRWVEGAAVIEDVTIAYVTWDLTEATKTSANTEVRSRAVKDAVAKASVFAQAVGLGQGHRDRDRRPRHARRPVQRRRRIPTARDDEVRDARRLVRRAVRGTATAAQA